MYPLIRMQTVTNTWPYSLSVTAPHRRHTVPPGVAAYDSRHFCHNFPSHFGAVMDGDGGGLWRNSKCALP